MSNKTELKPNFYTCFSKIENNINEIKIVQEQITKKEQTNTEAQIFGTKKSKYNGLSQIEKFNMRYKK